jgi:hypothetical protein
LVIARVTWGVAGSRHARSRSSQVTRFRSCNVTPSPEVVHRLARPCVELSVSFLSAP